MMSSSPTPKLPKWIFFLTDAVLLLTAWFIASRSAGPLSSTAVLAITSCVVVGAIVGTIPLVLHYEREKNETLDDRQRALEALALTLTTAAEQIGIAAKGLHEIAEISQKNLKLAEQLPQKLGEKVAELQAQLGAERDEERDELKKDLTALRAVESSQLTATADKVHKAIAELTKLEAAAQKSLAAAQAAITKTPETLAAATTTALAEIDAKLAARTTATLAALEAAEAKRISQIQAETAAPAVEPPGPPDGIERRKTPQRRATDIGRHITPVVPPTSAPFTGNIISLSPAPAESAADEIIGEHIKPVVPPTSAPFTGNIISLSAAADMPAAETPRIVPASDDTPVPEAPKSKTVSTADPFRQPPAEPTADSSAKPTAAPEVAADATPGEEPRPVKKRAPRKPKPAEGTEAALDLGMAEAAAFTAPADDFSQVAPNEPAEKAISADGATRLLVTAYIGIGNRLFIRGEGPGLSWDKGVPLQFVSIGKWRWEAADAAAPVKYKLYKNDDIECSALGAQSLDSGHQQEITATF